MADCPTLTLGAQGLKVRMPGGATLQVMTPDILPNNLQITKSLLTQASAALTPLTPLFNLIDAMLAVKAFAEAVPKLLTDPTALAQAITELIKKIVALARLIPQLSVPFMIIDLIDLTIAALDGVVDELDKIIQQETRILAAATRAQATGNNALLQISVCADGINTQVKNGLSDSLGALNSLFVVINTFLSLIGAPPIEPIGNLSSSASELVSELSDVVDALQTVRSSIPIP